MSAPFKRKFYAEYGIYLIFRSALRRLPYHFLMDNGNIIGRWIYHIFGVRRGVALANLRYAFGDSHHGKPIQVIAHEMYGHFFKMALELSNIHKIIDHMDTYIQFKNLEIYKDAMKKGQGALMMTGHFGNFELGASALARAGFPLTFIIKPLRNPLLNRELRDMRLRYDTEAFHVDYGARGILSALRRNRVVCMLGDQDVGQLRGTTVQFFGHPTSAPTGTARMAIQTHAPVIPTFLYRKPSGTHVLDIAPPLDVDYSRNLREQETQRITQETASILERWVSCYPEQYFWVHRRWKSTADGKWLYPQKKKK